MSPSFTNGHTNGQDQLNSKKASTNPTSTVFDSLNDAYAQTYVQGSLQLEYIHKLAAVLSRGCSVLDIGCASGVPNAHVLAEAGMHVTGIDASNAMVDLQEGTFPAIPLCKVTQQNSNQLNHPSSYNKTMKTRMASWLKAGGYLLFGTVDFSEYPPAKGYDLEPTGRSFHHSFMGDKVIKDSTFTIGEWMQTLREVGLVPVDCSQKLFAPHEGVEIEPEPQFYMIATSSQKAPLLGPYSHPYQHYPCSSTEQMEIQNESWINLSKRRRFQSPLSPVEQIVTAVSAKLGEYPRQETQSVRLDWALDRTSEPERILQACLSASPEVKRISILQASPSNDVLRIVNAVRKLLGHGPQHHGVVLSNAMRCVKEMSLAQCQTSLSVVPAHLGLEGISMEELSGLIVDVWLADVVEKSAGYEELRRLVEWHLQSYHDEYRQLGLEYGKKIGFDCVELVLERSV